MLNNATTLANQYGFITLLLAAEKSMWNRIDELENIKGNPRTISRLRDMHAAVCETIKDLKAYGWRSCDEDDNG